MDDAVFNVKNCADKFWKVYLNWIKYFTWRRNRKWKGSDNGFEGKMYQFFSRMAYQIISSSAKLQHQLMFWSKSPKGHLLVTPYGGEVSSLKAVKACFSQNSNHAHYVISPTKELKKRTLWFAISRLTDCKVVFATKIRLSFTSYFSAVWLNKLVDKFAELGWLQMMAKQMWHYLIKISSRIP